MQRSVRRYTRTLIVVVIVLILFFVTDGRTALAAEKIRAIFPSLATALSPSWVTAEKGFWKKYGLDVELIYLDGGARSVSALVGGSAEFVIGSDVAVTIANIQGAKLVSLGVTTNSLGYALVTQPSIRSSRDLKGKTLGITRGRDASYARLAKVLHDNGLDPKDDSAEKPSVHPSRASGRTEAVEIIGDFPFMLSLVEAFIGFFSRIIEQMYKK